MMMYRSWGCTANFVYDDVLLFLYMMMYLSCSFLSLDSDTLQECKMQNCNNADMQNAKMQICISVKMHRCKNA